MAQRLLVLSVVGLAAQLIGVASSTLLLLGVYIFARFTLVPTGVPTTATMLRGRLIDAVSGGGWRPVATPSLLASVRMESRRVIGSVGTSELTVAHECSGRPWAG